MTYKGKVKGGVVVLEGNVKLPDGVTVDVDVPEPAGDENAPTLFERLKPVIGKAEGLPADAAAPRSDEPVLDENGQTLGQKLLRYAGKATGLPPDASRNHDHYLYGTPKR